MALETFLTLVAFAFVAAGTPGPNTMMLFSSGVNFGFWRTVPHMLGISCGFCSLLLGVGLGLGAALQTFPALDIALKLAGGGYLLYLAWKIAGGSAGKVGRPERPMRFYEAAAFQWVNPKAWLISASAMTTFSGVAADGSPDITARLPVMCALFFAVVILSGFTWAGIGAGLSRWLQDGIRLRVANIVLALLLLSSLFLA